MYIWKYMRGVNWIRRGHSKLKINTGSSFELGGVDTANLKLTTIPVNFWDNTFMNRDLVKCICPTRSFKTSVKLFSLFIMYLKHTYICELNKHNWNETFKRRLLIANSQGIYWINRCKQEISFIRVLVVIFKQRPSKYLTPVNTKMMVLHDSQRLQIRIISSMKGEGDGQWTIS